MIQTRFLNHQWIFVSKRLHLYFLLTTLGGSVSVAFLLFSAITYFFLAHYFFDVLLALYVSAVGLLFFIPAYISRKWAKLERNRMMKYYYLPQGYSIYNQMVQEKLKMKICDGIKIFGFDPKKTEKIKSFYPIFFTVSCGELFSISVGTDTPQKIREGKKLDRILIIVNSRSTNDNKRIMSITEWLDKNVLKCFVDNKDQ